MAVVYFMAAIILPFTSGEVFTASADLTSTFRLEQQVVNVLGELLAQTEAKLGVIRRYYWRYNSLAENYSYTYD